MYPRQIDGLAKAATDPSSRLSVLLLPSNTGGDATLAILPLFQEEIDLESLGVDTAAWGTEGLASYDAFSWYPSEDCSGLRA